jgi:hypothetical protein
MDVIKAPTLRRYALLSPRNDIKSAKLLPLRQLLLPKPNPPGTGMNC